MYNEKRQYFKWALILVGTDRGAPHRYVISRISKEGTIQGTQYHTMPDQDFKKTPKKYFGFQGMGVK